MTDTAHRTRRQDRRSFCAARRLERAGQRSWSVGRPLAACAGIALAVALGAVLWIAIAVVVTAGEASWILPAAAVFGVPVIARLALVRRRAHASMDASALRPWAWDDAAADAHVDGSGELPRPITVPSR